MRSRQKAKESLAQGSAEASQAWVFVYAHARARGHTLAPSDLERVAKPAMLRPPSALRATTTSIADNEVLGFTLVRDVEAGAVVVAEDFGLESFE